MAFTNTPNEGTPFYRGIAPIVPEPSDTAAKIISAGAATGINAFVQMALGRERAQLAQQELLQRADLAAKNLEFQREEMKDRHGLALSAQGLQAKGLDLQQQRLNDDFWLENQKLDHQINNIDAETDLKKRQAEAYGGAMTYNVEVANKRLDYLDKAGETWNGMRLGEDPNLVGPALYGKNALGFERLYGSTLDPILKKKVEEAVNKATASKAKLEDDAGQTQEVPWMTIVQDIDRKGMNSRYVPMIQRSGYMKTVKGMFKTESGTMVESTSREPVGELKRWLEGEKEGTPLKEIDKFTAQQDPYAQAQTGVLSKSAPGTKGRALGDVMRSGDIKHRVEPTDVPLLQQEADWVNAENARDPSQAAERTRRFNEAHPGAGSLIQ